MITQTEYEVQSLPQTIQQSIISQAKKTEKIFTKLNKYVSNIHRNVFDDLPLSEQDMMYIGRQIDK